MSRDDTPKPPNDESHRTSENDQLPLDRRDYLKYLGVVGGTTVGGTFADEAVDTAAATTSTTDQEGDDGQEDDAPPSPLPEPTALTVDHESGPTNLTPNATPRFSWLAAATERGRGQSAYQIRLSSGGADVWDSGRVESTQSTMVPYDGPALEPDATYRWAVRVWDRHGQVTEWSDPATFGTARQADPDEWSATWVGRDTRTEGGLTGTAWTNYTFETTFTIETAAAGFVFRATDASNLYMWQVVLASSPDASGDQHVLRPHVQENGAWTRLASVPIDGALAGSEHESHRFRVEAVDDTFVTSIDGEVVDERSDATHTSGTVGFRQYETETASFDDVQVETPDRTTLFAEDFSSPVLTSFESGSLEDDALALSGSGIVLHADRAPDPSPLLRREFTADRSVEEARVHVAGVGYSELHLNGERVGDDQLNPAWTTYEDRVVYSSYDVTDLVEEGTNAVGVWLGKGWFSKDTPSYMRWSSYGPPRAFVELDVTYRDGTTETVTTDDAWTTTPSPILENDIYDGETYDARQEADGWAEPGFDDGDWDGVDELAAPGDDYVLQPQRTQPIQVTDELEPEFVERHDGGFVVDFGQNHSGWVELTIRGADPGDEIVLEHAEVRDDDGDLVMEDLRGAAATDRYVADGDDVETYSPRFTYHGYRYVEVQGYPGTLTADDVTAQVVHTNKSETGTFACSDDELTQVQHNSVWGLQSNSHSIPTDCPQRDERLGWTGDAHMVARAELFNFDAARFLEKWMRDHDDDQTPDGASSDTIPSAVSDSDSDPNWAKTMVTVPWYIYWHTGDEQVLRERYEGMQAYVDYWHGNADDHVVAARYQHYGDWLAFEDTPDAALLNTWAYYQATRLFARAADELGETADAQAYHARADDIAAAFNDAFFDEQNGVYGSGSQTTYALPLFEGIVPDEHEERVASNLASKVRNEDDGKLQTGFIGTRPLLFSLVEYDYEDLAYQVVSQPEQPGWVYMVRQGATTMWERWDSDERVGSGMNSFNHRPWAEVSEWFYRVLAGVDTVSAGYEQIEIDPLLPDDLDWAEASVDTVRGEVASSWERTDRGVELSVTVPWNSTATVHVPAVYPSAVTVDGEPLADATDVTFEEMEDGAAVLGVGSGEYTFLSDPVRGGAGFANETATDTLDDAQALHEQGDLTSGQANHLRASLTKLERQTANALAARDDRDRSKTRKTVQHALSTANSLADWLADERLAADPANQLEDAVGEIVTALSHASAAALDASVTATFENESVVAGGSTTLVVSIHNDGDDALQDVAVEPEAPAGWTLTPQTDAHAGVVQPGETFSVPYEVDVPVSQERGNVAVDAQGTYRYRGGTAERSSRATAEVGSPVAITDLSAHPVDPGETTTLTASLSNGADSQVSGTLTISLPDDWTADATTVRYRLPADGTSTQEFAVTAPEDAAHGVRVQATATYAGNFAGSATTGVYLGPSAAWNFETDGDAEGWESWNDITEFTVAEGALSFRSTGGDPFMGTTGLDVDAPNGLAVEIRMRTTADSGGQLFWTTEGSPNWSEGKSTEFDVTGGEWQTYTVEVPPQDTALTALRLDAVRTTASVDVDYIRVYY